MPRIFRDHHDQIVNQFFNIGFSYLFHTKRDLFIVNKSGILKIITVQIKVIYSEGTISSFVYAE